MSGLVLGFTTGWVVPLLSPEKRNPGIESKPGNWIFDTCHFHSAAPCSLATHKDFSCHSLACYHDWAQVLRNPITTTVSDSDYHVCYSRVPQIREDVLISSFSSLQTSLPPPFQSVCLRFELLESLTTDTPVWSWAGWWVAKAADPGFRLSDIKWYCGVDLTVMNNGEHRKRSIPPKCQTELPSWQGNRILLAFPQTRG